MKKIIIMLLLSAGCYYGVAYYQSIYNSPPKVDPALQDIVQQWENAMTVNDIDYKEGFNRIDRIRIVDDYGVDAGHYDKGSRTIFISKKIMERGFHSTRVVMYHELGHYVFDLKHSKDSTHIMYERTIPNIKYKLNWWNMKDLYIIKCKAK